MQIYIKGRALLCYSFYIVENPVCHCLLFLEKLCDAQFREVFHELAKASLNLERK